MVGDYTGGILPLHNRQTGRSTSFRLLRWWRSNPRKKKMVYVSLMISFIFFLYYSCLSEQTSLVLPTRIYTDPLADHVDVVYLDTKKVTNVSNSVPVFLGPQNERQRAVRNAFKHAWQNYKIYAWGRDQLKPISKSYSEWFDVGLTIVDSLDTAIIMGLDKEVQEGTDWITNELSFDKNKYVNFFETSIRVLGGLLSCYHLTGNEIFKTRSIDLADRLLGAFESSKSSIPLSDVNLQSRAGKSPQWSNEASLSEVTTVQLEFRDLSRISGIPKYEEIAFNVSKHVHSLGCEKHGGLCDMYLLPNTGKFKESTTITFGARADSYYEYLFKQWIQTGKTIDWLKDDYVEAMDSMEKLLLRKSEPNQLMFVGELLGGETYSPKMDHLVCFLAGTLALGSKNGLPEHHMDIAKGIGKACKAMYENPTGLGPEIAHYNMLPGQKYDLNIKPLDAHSLLRPEAIEGWFYLYRLTGDKIYQEWGWEAFEAIEKYARVATGYSSVNSVKKIPVTYRDLMESFYLAETLKYLYLLFADDQSELPLDKWVYNTEAHALPIYDH